MRHIQNDQIVAGMEAGVTGRDDLLVAATY
jgi:hypothetical protein